MLRRGMSPIQLQHVAVAALALPLSWSRFGAMTKIPRPPSFAEFIRSFNEIFKFTAVLCQEPFEEYQSQVYIIDDSAEAIWGFCLISLKIKDYFLKTHTGNRPIRQINQISRQGPSLQSLVNCPGKFPCG